MVSVRGGGRAAPAPAGEGGGLGGGGDTIGDTIGGGGRRTRNRDHIYIYIYISLSLSLSVCVCACVCGVLFSATHDSVWALGFSWQNSTKHILDILHRSFKDLCQPLSALRFDPRASAALP